MADQKSEGSRSSWRKWVDFTQSASIIALALSLLSFYRSYFYVNQQLDVTVTEVSYSTNRGELYMTVAFSNGGNRDAAVLAGRSLLNAARRVDAAMQGTRASAQLQNGWLATRRRSATVETSGN